MTSPRKRTIGNRFAPPRFLVFLGVFAAAGVAVQLATADWTYAVMGGFDTGAIVFLLSLIPLFNDADAASIGRHAAQNDANRTTLLVLAALIGAVLFITIWAELQAPGKPLASLIIVTLALSWLFGNAVYTLHYAHLFYGKDDGANGLTMPGATAPDYWDFAYFAFTLGMTFQTSDVEIHDRTLRRVALAQCVVAFIFNIGILAFTINTLGG